jgi:nucleotide-binding universal stress UspA family protein
MSDGERPDSGTGEAAPPEDVIVILAAIDTSKLASQVVEVAARMARRTWDHAQLHLMHVFPTSRFDRRTHGVDRTQLLAEAQEYLDHYVRMARRLFPASVTGHLAEGDPASEILSRARSLSADWLLMGTEDTVGLERFLLGSVADKIAKDAPCSAIVVRQKHVPYVKVK